MQYYYLVAGLPEYPFDIDGIVTGGLRIDVPEIKKQIMGALSPLDRRAVELLYTYYDIENIVGYIKGTKLPFNELGNLTPADITLLVDRTVEGQDGASQFLPEELAEREQALAVPSALRLVIDRFRNRTNADETNPAAEEIAPLAIEDLERELYLSFYKTCGAVSDGKGFSLSDLCPRRAVPQYLRMWADCDRMTRNIVAAYKSRQLGLPAEAKESMIVEENREVREALINSQAADFGLKDHFIYTEPLLQVLDTEDFVERERKMDELRCVMADSLAEHDYFGIGRVMNYLIRLNILHRWASLDAERGRTNFRDMVSGLTDPEKIAVSVGVQY